ncbi:MAG: hypothetical protein HZA14_11405 [Nitrospirae bacterium]|nr:hypothetical protein [Nitrospirota bacterium]
MPEKFGRCDICKKEYTTLNVEAMPGRVVYVCHTCIEKAKENFIWLCMSCGKAYIRPKDSVINGLQDQELKKAYLMCKEMLLIQGIDVCTGCHPEMMLDYMESRQAPAEC